MMRFKNKVHPEYKALGLFCCLHVLGWTIAPIIIRGNVPFDTLESIAWGNLWQWGYDKHPPLAAWLSAAASSLGQSIGWPTYLLSQLCVISAFIAIYTLAREWLKPRAALLAVMVLEGIYYYNIAAEQFNPNVLMLATWAITLAFYYRALKTQSYGFWACAFFTAGLTLLAKYQSIVLLVNMGLMLLTPPARHSFKNPAFYWGIVLFFLTILPNGLWLFKHDFLPFAYATARGVETRHTFTWDFMNHLFHPLEFLLEQTLAVLPCVLLFFANSGQRVPTQHQSSALQQAFLWIMGLGPLCFTLLLSLLSGMWLNALWGFPYFSLFSLLLFVSFRPKINKPQWLRGRCLMLTYCLIVLVGRYSFLLFGPFFSHHTNAAHFPGKPIAFFITHLWHQHIHTPLRFIVGDHVLVECIAAYSPDKPRPYFQAVPKNNPWIDETELAKQGAIFVWRIDKYVSLPKTIQQRFPTLIYFPPAIFKQLTQATVPPIVVGIALLKPQSIIFPATPTRIDWQEDT